MIIPQSGPGRPPSSDAYEVSDAWQLGVPLAEYQAAPAGFCALLLASIGIFIALVVWAALSFSIFALLLAGLAAVAILGIWGALRECYKDRRRGFCKRFSCTEGLGPSRTPSALCCAGMRSSVSGALLARKVKVALRLSAIWCSGRMPVSLSFVAAM